MNHLKLEVNEEIATIFFNRESALNALNTESLMELYKLIQEIKMREDIKILIFTGVGKAFIAGADISEMANMTPDEAYDYSKMGATLFYEIEQLNKVTVAAINGFCLGGGNELALACDLRLASPKAKIGQPEVTLGITPGFSGTQRLARLLGAAKAMEMLFLGKILTSQEALECGLIHRVIVEENFLEGVTQYLNPFLQNSFLAMMAIKKAIHEGMEWPLNDAIQIETEGFSSCFSTNDQKEGMQAFLEKRKPNFKSWRE